MRNRAVIAISCLALVTACSQGAREETATRSSDAGDEIPIGAAEEPAIKLYALDCGRIEVKNLALFDEGGAYDGRTDNFVDTCWLVRHPQGDLLWDTGLPDALNALPDGSDSGDFHARMPKTLKGQLAEIGLAATDIEFLSVSHSHFDHTGNANDYAGATWLVHSAERAHMFRDEARADAQSFGAYSALESSKTVTFAEDHDVFGDGSVTIVPTPGHTPGHSVLLVRLPETGPVLLSGDLYHLQEAREKRTVPVFNTDADETRRSMDKFEKLAADSGARVILQHEDADYDALPKAPDYLN